MKHFKISLLMLLFSPTVLASITLENRDAQTKAKEIWNKIIETAYTAKMPKITPPTTWDGLSLLNAEYDSKAFSHDGDIMMNGRKKLIHSFGVTAQVEFVANVNSSFTGLFASGAPYGVIRISLAVPSVDGSTPKIVPGLALKFFIDGKPSVNIMAMPSLDGQVEENIFTHVYRTNVAKPAWSLASWLIEKRFAAALGYVGQPDGNPRSLSLVDLGRFTSSGVEIRAPVVPFEIALAASKEIEELFETGNAKDFRVRLMGHGDGIKLFDVYSKQDDGDGLLIGSINAKSNFVASSYGDEKLFFKHPPVHNAAECKAEPEL